MRTPIFAFRYFPKAVFWSRRLRGANYEPEMKLLDVLCDPTRTGVDIGAKIGMYTYRIAARCADAIAFEPNPLFNRMLTRVFAGKRARIEPFALSNVQGTAVMRLPYDHNGTRQFGRSTIDPANPLVHNQIARVEEIEVETRRLDDYALSNVGFIKIDVEGHELSVLEGAAETVARNSPVMLIECNDHHRPAATRDLAAWLGAHDYGAWFRDGKQLRSLDTLDDDARARGIENFMCVPRSRADVHEKLVARVAAT